MEKILSYKRFNSLSTLTLSTDYISRGNLWGSEDQFLTMKGGIYPEQWKKGSRMKLVPKLDNLSWKTYIYLYVYNKAYQKLPSTGKQSHSAHTQRKYLRLQKCCTTAVVSLSSVKTNAHPYRLSTVFSLWFTIST